MGDWSLGDIKEFYFDWRNVGPYQITELLGWFSQSPLTQLAHRLVEKIRKLLRNAVRTLNKKR